MQNILAWIKANPISDLAIALVLVAVGVLVFVHIGGKSFLKEMTDQQGKLTQMDRFMQQRVEVPGPNPNDPPVPVGPITITNPAINQLTVVFDKIGGEYTQVFKIARDINRAGHEPMLPNLFPNPQGSAPFAAKDIYPRTLLAILGPGAPNVSLPALNAKPPLDPLFITEQLDHVEQQYKIENMLGQTGTFTPDQFEELRRRKSRRLAEMLDGHASSLGMYAQTQLGPDFPFDVPEWVGGSQAPNEIQLWTGQMMLWIQQDIASAIALTNGDNKVQNSVIKRLIATRVVRGSVGIRNKGGFAYKFGDGATGTFAEAPVMPVMPVNPADPTAQQQPVASASVDTRLPDDFTISPTARTSNAMYDVWHVWVHFVADSRKLPEFFNALGQVNFMSVLSVETRNIDEFAALHEGYDYGTGDAVDVKILIETIWLRDWTLRLMPTTVQTLLGIAPPPQG